MKKVFILYSDKISFTVMHFSGISFFYFSVLEGI